MDFNKYSEIGKDNGFSDEQIQKGWSLYSSKQIDPASVENNFSDLSSAEAALSFTENPKEESMIGKIAGYFSSSVKGDFDQIYNNVKEFSQEFTGNSNSTIESTYNDIQYEVLNFNQENSTDNILNAIIDDQLGDQAEAYKDVVTQLKDIQVPELEAEVVEKVKEPTQRKKYTPRVKEPSYDERVSELTGAYGEADELLYKQLKSELPFTVDLQSNRENIIRGLQESERFLQLSEDEQISAYQAELVRDNPLAQFTTGAYETLLPEFIRKEIPFDVPDVESTPDLFFRMSGNISGFIGSLVGAGRIVKGLGGVRAIPQVGTYLNLVGKNNPKAAMYLEDALTSFAAFTLRNQTYVDPTTNITERAKLMKEDALYSIAFPVANMASQLRGGLAVGGGTMFAVGFHGEGTTTEKVVNGSALTLMYLIGQGVQYKQAKVQLKEFLKTSGIERNIIKQAGKTSDEFINSLDRPSIMKASANLKAMMYQQQSINRAAGEAQAKAARGKTLTLTDKIEVAAANQSSSVGLTKVGALPPIKGNRATKQLEQTVKLARQEAIKTEPTPVAEPTPTDSKNYEKIFLESEVPYGKSGRKGSDLESIPIDAILGKDSIVEFIDSKGKRNVPEFIINSIAMNAIEKAQKLLNTDKTGASFLGKQLIDKNLSLDKKASSSDKLERGGILDAFLKAVVIKDGKNDFNKIQESTKDFDGKTVFIPRKKINKDGTYQLSDAIVVENSLSDAVSLLENKSYLINNIPNDASGTLKAVMSLEGTGKTDGSAGYYVRNQKEITEPTPVAEPAPAEDLAVKQTNLYTPSASELKAQEANILSNYSNPQTVAYELSKAPTLPADILMNESQQLIPYLDQASRFVEPRESMLPIKEQMRQMGDAERTFGLFVNFFRKFGTAYVSDKKLSDKLETSFSEIASAPLRGVREVAEAFKKFPKTSRQDRMDVTFAYESAAKDSLEPRLQPIYDLVQSAMTQMENSLITAGVLKKSFAELRDERIKDLMKELDIAQNLKFREKKIEQELLDEIKFLDTVRNYLSHSVVLQRVVEAKSKTLSIKERKNFTNKLTDLYQKRKGKLTLKEHFDSGLLSEADVDIVKLTMGTYADGFQKLAIRSLVDWGKDLGYIVPKNAKLIDPKNYVLGTDTSYGNRISDLQNKKIHVLFDDGFKEILGYNRKPANWYTRLLGAIKIGQFFNPAIIYKYNALQAFYGGSWTINPKTVAKAFTAVNTKNELFLELDKYGLYQKQDLPIKKDIDREIAIASRQTLDRVGDSFKSRVGDILSDQAGFNKNDINKMLSDKKFMDAITTIISSPSSVVGNLTWYGDEVQRTMSAITLINKGYSPKKAAQTAARIHGAYSLVGTKYKQTMRNIAFVYSFRMLMPWRYNIQPTATLINEAYKKATGKQGDKRKTKAAAWTLGVTMGIPLVVDMTLRANGWTDAMEEEKSGFRKTLEPTVINIGEDGKYGKFRHYFPQWKYTKPVTMPDGTEKEIVLALGNILNMVSKGAVRSTAPIPESSNIPVDQAWNYLQWEINPTYKLIANYINNEPSFGELPPRGIDGTDWLGGMAWTIRKSFVVYDKTKWAEYLGLAEKKVADQVLDETFTTLEKIYNFFGNSYIRSAGEKRFTSMKYKFLEDIKESARNIQFAEIPEEKKEEAKRELFERIEQFNKDLEKLKE